MNTEIVPISPDTLRAAEQSKALARRLKARTMSRQEWIDAHGSGTLRKNSRIGMRSHSQYLKERVAWEFGWEWECVPASRVTIGDAVTEGDCSTLTEAGWFIDRYMSQNLYDSDAFACRYIRVCYPEGSVKEGVGIVCLRTCASFFPLSHFVFAIVGEWDSQSERWKPARNPC